MKSAIVAVVAQAALIRADPWFNGAPACAQTCLSSAWSSASASDAWPSPTDFCGGNAGSSASSCLASACTGSSSTAISSWSSFSSTACSHWSSCSSAGSTGVLTITASGPGHPGFGSGAGWKRNGPPFGPGGPGGNWDGSGAFTATVTGCPWVGNPWAGGPWGGAIGGGGPGAFFGWGNGWSQLTTQTITTTVSTTSNGNGFLATSTLEVAEAVSGGSTSSVTLSGTSSSSTSSSGAKSAAGPAVRDSSLPAVWAVAAVFGAFIVTIGLL